MTILKMGSANELAETLVSFGCNTNASNCVRSETKKHGHLFPCSCPPPEPMCRALVRVYVC